MNVDAVVMMVVMFSIIILAGAVKKLAQRIWNLEFDYLQRNREEIPDFYELNEEAKKRAKKALK